MADDINNLGTSMMSQDRQKTVIAFVAGLLIGGLLVWVFTSSTGGTTTDDESGNGAENGAMMEDDEDAMDDEDDVMTGDTMGGNGGSTAPTPSVTPDNEGALAVNDQAAGNTVTLAEVSYPTTGGWVVVKDGDGSGILGAARYDTSVGLMPTSVALLRSTEVDSEYMVVFYTEDGDGAFNTANDVEMSGTASVMFSAQ